MPSVYQGGRKDGHGQVSPIARDCPDNAEFFKSNVDIGAQRSSSQDAPKPAPVDSIATPPLTPPGIAVAGLKNHGAAAATSSSSDDLDDLLRVGALPLSVQGGEPARRRWRLTRKREIAKSNPFPQFCAGGPNPLFAMISCHRSRKGDSVRLHFDPLSQPNHFSPNPQKPN